MALPDISNLVVKSGLVEQWVKFTVQSTDCRLVGNDKQDKNIEFVCPGNLQKPPFQTFSTAPFISLMKVGGVESYFLESCWLFQIYSIVPRAIGSVDFLHFDLSFRGILGPTLLQK